MTDKKTEIPQTEADSKATTAESKTVAPDAKTADSGSKVAAPEPASATHEPKAKPGPSTSVPPVTKSSGFNAGAGSPQKGGTTPKRRSVLLLALIVALIIVAVLAAVVWYQQQQMRQTNADLANQVQQSQRHLGQVSDQAQQALALVQEQSAQIASLQDSLGQVGGQIDGLDQAFQTLTDSSSDLVLLNDVDHLATIAQQQLQLGGNVANAVISLETAQAQLARANRPGLASLQQTLNGDLDRLRAASTIDIAQLSLQLDELSALVSEAPLLVPDDAAPEPVTGPQDQATAASDNQPAPTVDPDAPWWERSLATAQAWTYDAWDAVSQDLGQFITVRRVDDATALLMSPDQATRFRETLRLRIMTAQLALMMRQPKVWEAETDTLLKAIETRFDEQASQSRQALKIARHMADTSIDVKLPTVANTLQAIEVLREEGAKSAASNQASPTDHESVEPVPQAGQPVDESPAEGATDTAPSAPSAADGAATLGS